jgi:carbamoyl-phosphate synthase large subunit
VKTPVFPFVRFQGVDTLLGPEMKSTGEAMGCGPTFGVAFAKAQEAVGQTLPDSGLVFVSVNDHDKPNALPIMRDLAQLGFSLAATRGTAAYLAAHGLQAEVFYKVNEGRPNIADHTRNGRIALVINTPLGRASFFDDRALRRAAMVHGIPCITTLTGASAAVAAIRAMRGHEPGVRALQDYHADLAIQTAPGGSKKR